MSALCANMFTAKEEGKNKIKKWSRKNPRLNGNNGHDSYSGGGS